MKIDGFTDDARCSADAEAMFWDRAAGMDSTDWECNVDAEVTVCYVRNDGAMLPTLLYPNLN